MSTDEKPTNCAVNSLFLELDTGDFYYFNGIWKKVGENVQLGATDDTGTIQITENGTVDVYDYDYADVNVPGVIPTGILPITENGNVNVTNYATAEVGVDYVTVNLNGNKMEFTTPARIINGNTMVPMRSFFEDFGANVYWYGEQQIIVASKGSILMTMKIGSKVMLIQNAFSDENITKPLDTAPLLIDNTTFIPLRAAAECFGAEVLWDSNEKAANLTVY